MEDKEKGRKAEGNGIRTPGSPNCRLCEQEAIGAYVYTPAESVK